MLGSGPRGPSAYPTPGRRRRRYISGPGNLKDAVADKLVRFARGRQGRSGGGKKPAWCGDSLSFQRDTVTDPS
jgi:hypothetical protein